MSKTEDAICTFQVHSAVANETWSRWLARARDGLRDMVAGVVAAVVLVANIVSFGALMFPGEFSAGIPIVVWSMLIGSCICGVWIALATSLPPLTTGIDSPTGTVLVLLSALVGARVVAAGGSPQAAVQIVTLLFTVATPCWAHSSTFSAFADGVRIFGSCLSASLAAFSQRRAVS
jgi:hypothetical protein